ncbi:superoxide dismutase family protein [Novosphingobium huizhouense]|uniref:superoxide dismutase family protein n=1 Tax=Novosphingobium huizhouense TaxID=2866625 RepID=UPI001CD905D8|nr:superoxide dismutase family protein [Novosphingobium huizhouense]
MNRLVLAAAAGGLALATSGCATVAPAATTIATAEILDATGAPIGTATVTDQAASAVLSVDARALKPGQHGLHLHATGRCEAPAFTSAGPHLNPSARAHGMHNPAGPHLGDLPNLDVGADGSGRTTATLPGSIADIRSALFDQDGTAIVIHQSADDYMTDPSGNSGSRIACGVFKPA